MLSNAYGFLFEAVPSRLQLYYEQLLSLQFEWVNDAEIQIAMSLRVSIFSANIIEILKHNCQVTHSNYTNQLMWLILYAKICELDWKNIPADSLIVCCFLFGNIPSICLLHDIYIRVRKIQIKPVFSYIYITHQLM